MVLKVAIIGLGNIAYKNDLHSTGRTIKTYIQAFEKNKNTRVVTACDIDPEAIQEFVEIYPGVNVYSNHIEMMQIENPDIVCVCSPTSQNTKIITDVAEFRPKVVMTETPFAYNLEDASFIATECLRNDVELIVNHQRRFDPMHQQIAIAIQNGLIGNITGGNLYYTNGVFQTGSQMLDLVRMLVGNVSSVQAFPESSIDAPDPTIGGRLIFSDKANLYLHAINVDNYNMFELDLYGTIGRIHIYNSGEDCDLYLAEKSTSVNDGKALRKVKNPFVKGLKQNLVSAVSQAVDIALHNTINVSSGENALKTLQVIMAFRKSFYGNGEVVQILQNQSASKNYFEEYLFQTEK